MLERKLWRNFDYLLLLTVLAISLLGLLVLRSATENNATGDSLYIVRRQLIWIVAGMCLLFVVVLVDYSYYGKFSHYLYGLNIILLVVVLFIGRQGGGAIRWIDLKFFDLQPSELAKIVIIVALAKLLAEREGEFEGFADLVVPFAYVLFPMVLIFIQPDLGTSLVFLAVLFAMLYMGGVPTRQLLIIALSGCVVGMPLLWQFLKPYQKMRLIVFLNPGIDPIGSGYQLLQSMIAIGAGGVAGYFFRTGAFMQGSQSGLNFLPAKHTDFIFSVLGEEFGFLGTSVLLLLFFYLVYRIVTIASLAKDTFGTLICVGVAAMIIFQVFVNIGMTVGIMPVTGLPLPFMSYGGSSYLINIMGIGLVLNVGMRRQKILF